MNSNRKIVLGIAAVAILILSVGAVYAVAAPQHYQQGDSFAGTTGGRGNGGGMMGGRTTNPGGMMSSQGGIMGAFGNTMSSMQSEMVQYEGMMSRMVQHMGGIWSHALNGTVNDKFVAIMNFAFYPSGITVPVGTTVTWVNMDFVQHTVTSGTEGASTVLFDSHELGHMQSFSYTFNAPGTYSYYCDLHPKMIGTIRVAG